MAKKKTQQPDLTQDFAAASAKIDAGVAPPHGHRPQPVSYEELSFKNITPAKIKQVETFLNDIGINVGTPNGRYDAKLEVGLRTYFARYLDSDVSVARGPKEKITLENEGARALFSSVYAQSQATRIEPRAYAGPLSVREREEAVGRNPVVADNFRLANQIINNPTLNDMQRRSVMALFDASINAGEPSSFRNLLAKASAETLPEDRFNPEARPKARGASALGIFQYTDTTFLNMVKLVGAKAGLSTEGMTKTQILDLRRDPTLLATLHLHYMKHEGMQNRTFAEQYTYHFLGRTQVPEMGTPAYNAMASANPHLFKANGQNLPSQVVQANIAAHANGHIRIINELAAGGAPHAQNPGLAIQIGAAQQDHPAQARVAEAGKEPQPGLRADFSASAQGLALAEPRPALEKAAPIIAAPGFSPG